MSKRAKKQFLCAGSVLLALGACTPLRDLDSVYADRGVGGVLGMSGGSGELTSSSGGVLSSAGTGGSAASVGGAPAVAGYAGSASGGTGGAPSVPDPDAGMAGMDDSGGGVFAGGGAGARTGIAGGGSAGAAGACDTNPCGTPATPQLGELPNDLRNAPVSGDVSYVEGSWSIDGVLQPAFYVETPTAGYTLLGSTGNVISMVDATAGRVQWVAYDNDYRPRRGVGVVGAPTTLTTTVDAESYTAKHVRFVVESEGEAWRWVWDFYVTHVSLTLTAASAPFGFQYRGVPGGQLGDEDRFVTESGSAQSAKSSFYGDLLGPSEWAYVADTGLRRSVFVVQQLDDTLSDTYEAREGDSAMLLFGNAQLTRVPARFSIGIVESGLHAAVQQRAEFVASAMR